MEHLGLLSGERLNYFPSQWYKAYLNMYADKEIGLGAQSSEQVKPGMHKSSKKVRHASEF